MDVRQKFLVWISILFIIVIFLFILVYLSATKDPLSGTKVPFDPVSINTEEIQKVIDDSNTLFPEVEVEKEIPVIATIELKDKLSPNKEFTEVEGIIPKKNEIIYKVTLKGSWSNQLHPNFYPSGAHMSPMVAWSHRIKNIVFETEEIASEGLEQVAESGKTGIIEKELTNLGENNFILDFTKGKLIDAPGTDSVQIAVSESSPYISVISMIAPSPDWFVAAHNILLFENGKWLTTKVIQADLYDSGTDSGNEFNSKNKNTNPQKPITKITSKHIKIPLATFEFVRL